MPAGANQHRRRVMRQDVGMAATYAEARETIGADPQVIYDLVADLTAMGKWSPESTGGRWIKGATGPAVGATFQGTNAAGWRRWSTLAQVTTADPGRCFAFHVSYLGVPIADWSYEFSTEGGTTEVVEKWTERRPGWMIALSKPVMGVSDRAVHNQRNMAVTLTNLKQAAESQPA
jgi:hypothetical protein